MLNGKQKRYLRSLAVNENAIFQIGKDARELIKVSVLKTCELDMNEIAVELCANTGAQLVQKIGKTLVLYKPSREKKILLP